MEMCDMDLGVGDPWVLKLGCVSHRSRGCSWRNKRIVKPVWQRLDRFYVPLAWMPQVWRLGVINGAFHLDHFLVQLELGLREGATLTDGVQCKLDFFRVNMDIARLEVGLAGV